MKKLLTALGIITAMCLCSLIPAGYTAYADNDSVTIISKIVGSAATDLSPGDKFYVEVSLSSVNTCAFAINASWDTDSLELTGAFAEESLYSGGTAFTYVPFKESWNSTVPEQALTDYQSGRTRDVCVFAYAAGENLNCSGAAVTLEFTVKQGADIGFSEIYLFFDPENPPEYFSPDHKSMTIDIAEGFDDEHDGIVYAEIISSQATETSSDTSSNFPHAVPEITKPIDPAFVTEIVEDDSAFFTVIIDDGSDTEEEVTESTSYPDINNGRAGDDYDLPDGRGDDVSAAAGASDVTSKSIRMIAIFCTAVMAALLILLMFKKQKQKGGNDRIK